MASRHEPDLILSFHTRQWKCYQYIEAPLCIFLITTTKSRLFLLFVTHGFWHKFSSMASGGELFCSQRMQADQLVKYPQEGKSKCLPVRLSNRIPNVSESFAILQAKMLLIILSLFRGTFLLERRTLEHAQTD